MNIVYHSAVGAQLPEIELGDRLRLLDVVVADEGKTFEIRPWTEVYRVQGEEAP